MTPPKKPVETPPAKKPRKKAALKPPPVVEVLVPPANVIEATRTYVAALPPSIRGSVLALTALHLADVLTKTDAARDSATIAKELRACLEDLSKAVGNAADKSDKVDEIAKKRAERQAKLGMK